jgi:hypothetical protein
LVLVAPAVLVVQLAQAVQILFFLLLLQQAVVLVVAVALETMVSMVVRVVVLV